MKYATRRSKCVKIGRIGKKKMGWILFENEYAIRMKSRKELERKREVGVIGFG